MKKRPYYERLWREFDAQKPLVMVSGARQTGKTTLAKAIAESEPSSL